MQNPGLRIAEREQEQMSQGRKVLRGDAWYQQDFLCKPGGWSGFREPVVPEGHPLASFTHKERICSSQIILVSLAAPPPDLYLFVSVVLIIQES